MSFQFIFQKNLSVNIMSLNIVSWLTLSIYLIRPNYFILFLIFKIDSNAFRDFLYALFKCRYFGTSQFNIPSCNIFNKFLQA